MSKPAKRCGCAYTHTYFFTKEKLAKVAKVCLSYSKIGYKVFEKVCKLKCNIQNKNYKYKKIGVV